MDNLEVGLETLSLITVVYTAYLLIKTTYETFKRVGLIGILYEIGVLIFILLVIGGAFVGIAYTLGIITNAILKIFK